MERLIGDLLEYLAEVYPKHITVYKLNKRDFNRELIIDCLEQGFVRFPYTKATGMDRLKETVSINDQIALSDKGMQFLIGIRNKKETELLGKSMKDRANDSKTMKILTIVVVLIALMTLAAMVLNIRL